MKRMKDIKIRASYTVEAAIIMPIIIFAVISIMFLTFYMHDRTILKLCAYHACIESVFKSGTSHDAAKEKINELNILTVEPTSIWTNGTDRKNVRYLGKYTAPFSIMVPFMGGEKVEEKAEACAKMKVRNMYLIKIAKKAVGKEADEVEKSY